jgi:tRNA1(Val) A37 N6-methylase TrmN6
LHAVAKRRPDIRKQSGAHYTPAGLAGFVAERLVRRLDRQASSLRVLDPACGEGELLLAIAERLPETLRRRSTLIGIEKDEVSYETARRRLNGAGEVRIEVIRGDFLAMLEEGSLLGGARRLDPVDVIIANPPYVRTQVIGSDGARKLAGRFGLTGRVDLYQAFLAAMTSQLRCGGLLGVITSNRFMSTRGGEATRRLLRSRFEEIEIFDLGDTKLFKAAVLPAVFFGRRRSDSSGCAGEVRAAFLKIYEEIRVPAEQAAGAPSVVSLLQGKQGGCFTIEGKVYSVSCGRMVLPETPSKPWAMLTPREETWLNRIRSHSRCKIGDVAKIRVGIKTTADGVFIRRDWDEVSSRLRPESKYLKPLLSQDEAARWRAVQGTTGRRRVLYTHEVSNGRRRAIEFPVRSRAWKYLQANRSLLERRHYVLDAGRRWYEIWVPQDPLAWRRPKVVFPDISPGPRFFLDREGDIVDGNCYWITATNPADEDLLLLILGVANSRLMERYHDCAFQNRLYSQRKRYLTQYVQEYPLPDRESPESQRIIRAADRLASGRCRTGEIASVEHELDAAVSAAFGCTSVSESSD